MDEEPIAPQEVRGVASIAPDIAARKQNVINEIARTFTQERSTPSLPYRVGGEVAGGVYDVLGNVVSEVTPDFIEDPLRKYAGMAGQYVSESAPVQAISKAGSDVYNYLGDISPEITRVIDESGDILGGAAMMAGVKPSLQATARGGGKVLGTMEKAANVKTVYPTVEKITNASNALYKKSKELGASFSPAVVDDIYKAGKKNLPKGKVSAKTIALDEADDFVKKVEKQLGASPELADFSEWDTHLGNKAAVAYGAKNKDLARKFTDMQIALRESATNPKNAVGGIEGISAHREATRLWGIKKKMEDVESAIKKGAKRGKTGIQTQFRRIEENPKLMRGYSDIEKKAITRAAETGNLDDVLNTMGSRLHIIGGAVAGGPKGALLGLGLSKAGRMGAEAVKKGQGGQVLRELGKRSGLVEQQRRFDPKRILGSLQQ
jgi:hypothetical protein